ncbi:4-galactosyl-N-acetylglucosaminide 3-alpha-L-fucosyltransferase 9-like [Pituophis catenifer annectens]|uniref:4-galactosyl-N-acetylglucosaminide 3-alpha-L-fucosyltransferase 9-like n=1 Tax=Pituophis catenifer annectens TaxID=94852 RepID=UPI003992F5A8
MSIPSKVFWSGLAFFLVLVCFGACLLVYIKPTQLWFYLKLNQDNSTSKQNVSFNQDEFQNNESNVTLVLLWLSPFGRRSSPLNCLDLNISDCHITMNRSMYNQSHAVIFHHRDIWWNLRNLPQQPRPLFQKWIWMNMESPSHSPPKLGLNRMFNLTLNYRRDADIHIPYGMLTFSPNASRAEVPPKDKLVCWVVSNRYPQERIRYYKELKKYIKIHTYGKMFGRRLSWEEYRPIMSSCKFYLAFENSIFKDYITEKIYTTFLAGTVPVVLGPPRENYEDYVLPESFIHVDDFESPKNLSEYLLMLDRNDTLYLSYFEWKKDFSVYRPNFWKSHLCSACDYVKKHPEYKSVGNLQKWFWNNSCDDFFPARYEKKNLPGLPTRNRAGI